MQLKKELNIHGINNVKIVDMLVGFCGLYFKQNVCEQYIQQKSAEPLLNGINWVIAILNFFDSFPEHKEQLIKTKFELSKKASTGNSTNKEVRNIAAGLHLMINYHDNNNEHLSELQAGIKVAVDCLKQQKSLIEKIANNNSQDDHEKFTSSDKRSFSFFAKQNKLKLASSEPPTKKEKNINIVGKEV
jgi:hypothetical protein